MKKRAAPALNLEADAARRVVQPGPQAGQRAYLSSRMRSMRRSGSAAPHSS